MQVLEFKYSKPRKRFNLKKVETRKLMQYLSIARIHGYFEVGNFPDVSIDELKAELATREHIPNKQEARKIRQEKAFAKKHR
jgi:hypothetical protein